MFQETPLGQKQGNLSLLFFKNCPLGEDGASLVAQMVKYLSAVWETQVQSLDQKDPLEKGTATHSIILAWRILWTEEPGGLQSMGSQELDTT